MISIAVQMHTVLLQVFFFLSQAWYANVKWGGGTFVAREDAIRVKNFIRNPSSGRQGEGGDELTPTQHASGSFDAVCPLSFLLFFNLRTFE